MRTTTHMLKRAFAVVVCMASVALLCADVRADTGNAQIDQGIALYNDLEYEKAITTLEAALKQPGLSKEEKTTGFQHLALAYLAVGRDADTKGAFKRLIEANWDYKPPVTISQKARDLFDEVKRSMPPPKKPPKPVVKPVVLNQVARPSNPKPGTAITVDARLTDPDNRVTKIIVHYRVRGQRSFSAVVAKRSKTGGAQAIISGAFVKGPAIEYYVVGQDAKGKTVASAGTQLTPVVLVVGTVAKKAAPLYAKWWFWTGTGVAVVGVVAGVLLLSGDGGGDSDATVVVTVEPPM